jgi:uncharacterized protein involved in exopolysaccharide biosynthesis
VADISGGVSSLISEIVQILNRRKWQILITFFSITGIVAAVTFLMPKKYETRMKILVKSERTAGNGYGSGGDVSENQVNTEMDRPSEKRRRKFPARRRATTGSH